MTKSKLLYIIACGVLTLSLNGANAVELFGRDVPSGSSSKSKLKSIGQNYSNRSSYTGPGVYPEEYFNSHDDFKKTIKLYTKGKAISDFMTKKGVDYHRGSQVIHQLSLETNSSNSSELLDAYKAYESTMRGNNLGSAGALSQKFEYFSESRVPETDMNIEEMFASGFKNSLSSKASKRKGEKPIGFQGFNAQESLSQPTLNKLKSMGLSSADINYIGGGVASGVFVPPSILALKGKNSPEVVKYAASAYKDIISSAGSSYKESEEYYKTYASEMNRYKKFIAKFKDDDYQAQADAYVDKYGVGKLKYLISGEVALATAILDNAEAFHKAAMAKAQEANSLLNDSLKDIDDNISAKGSPYNVDEIAGGIVSGIKKEAGLSEYGVGLLYDGNEFAPDITDFYHIPERDLRGLGFDGATLMDESGNFFGEIAESIVISSVDSSILGFEEDRFQLKAGKATRTAFLGWMAALTNRERAERDAAESAGFGGSGEQPKAKEQKARGSDAPPGLNIHDYCPTLEKVGNTPACVPMFDQKMQAAKDASSVSDSLVFSQGVSNNTRAKKDGGVGRPDKTAPVAILKGPEGDPQQSTGTDIRQITTEWPVDENGDQLTPGKLFSMGEADRSRQFGAFGASDDGHAIGPLVTEDQLQDYRKEQNRQIRENLGEDTSQDEEVPQSSRHNRKTGERHTPYSVGTNTGNDDGTDQEGEEFVDFMKTGKCDLMTVHEDHRPESPSGAGRGTFLKRNPDYNPGYDPHTDKVDFDEEESTEHLMYIDCEEGSEGCGYHVAQIINNEASPFAPLDDPDYTEKETSYEGSYLQYICHIDPKFTAICGTREMNRWIDGEYVWEATDEDDAWNTGYGWHNVDIVQEGGKIRVLEEDKTSYDTLFIILYEICYDITYDDELCCEFASYYSCRAYINPSVEPENFIQMGYTSAHFPDDVAEGLPALSSDPGDNDGKDESGLSDDWEGYKIVGNSKFALSGRDMPALFHWQTGVPGSTAVVNNFEPKQAVDSATIAVMNSNLAADGKNPTQGIVFDRSPSANQFQGLLSHQQDCLNAGYNCLCNNEKVFGDGTALGHVGRTLAAREQISNEKYITTEEVSFQGEDGLSYEGEIGFNNTPYYESNFSLPMGERQEQEGAHTVASSRLPPSLGQMIGDKVWPDVQAEGDDAIVREDGWEDFKKGYVVFYDQTAQEKPSPHMQDGKGYEKSHAFVVTGKLSDNCAKVTQSNIMSGSKLSAAGNTTTNGERIGRVVCLSDPGTFTPIDGREGIAGCHEGPYSPCLIHPDAKPLYGRIDPSKLEGACIDPKTGADCSGGNDGGGGIDVEGAV